MQPDCQLSASRPEQYAYFLGKLQIATEAKRPAISSNEKPNLFM